MKIKLIFYLCVVVFVANFVTARSEQKRRRPIIDTSAQDSDGNYVDQIALDSVNYASPSQAFAEAPENYPANFYTGIKPKKTTLSTEQKVQYVTPEIYSAPPKVTKENYPPSSGLQYTYINRTETKKSTTQKQKQKLKDDYADYNYYFPESKRINAKTPAKASTSPIIDQFYQPQSSLTDTFVRKEVSKNGDELTYHYYYPEESTVNEQKQSNQVQLTSPTIRAPSSSFSYISNKNKNSLEHTSTDAYQYPPVLQRPNEYDLNGSAAPHESFFSTYESPKNIKTHSTISPSTVTPVKILKPTKKNLHYLPSSTLSPLTTIRPKIRRPSTELPFSEVKKFSLPPSVTSSTMAAHYSTTTRAPELYAYSTVSPISSTTQNNDFYIKPSTQVTPTISSSSSDLYSDGSNERTVVIKPKVQYTHTENYEHQKQPTVKETIVYKYVDPQEYYGNNNNGGFGSFESNKTTRESEMFYTPTSNIDTAKTPEYYKELNKSTQVDMNFYNDFHKNYNYQYFTEQDAAKSLSHGDDKMDDHLAEEEEVIDDKQRASKKNMVFAITPSMEPRYQSSSIIPVNIQDHEVPPPMVDNEQDLTSEASKNQQYIVLYSVDDEEREKHRDNSDNQKEKKLKKKVRPEQEQIVFHQHHQQQHNQQQHQQDDLDDDYDNDFQNFDSEFDSEFDSDVVNSDNVRIVDPNVRGGRPIEFTKDDYLRHIKQAVVQYMKNIHVTKDTSSSSSTPKAKITKYQETQTDNHQSVFRPTKASLPIVSSTASYKNTLSPQQYKPLNTLKLPKNVYTADRLKEAIEDMQESPQIDLTVKKHKVKPFDLSAIDVGQTYQHVTHFDHSAALKNVEEFDQSNVMTSNGGAINGGNKQKLHFSQQTYHDINNLGHNQKQKVNDDGDNDNTNVNLYKNFVLPNKYQTKLVSNQNHQNQNTFSTMNYDASKLPRIVSQHSQNVDDDDDENKVDDTIDAPIQIINGIPVANPYNIDLNTLKYMLGGIAQAEVNDQLKDLDESSSQKVTNSWKGFSPLGSFTSNNPIYQVYGQQQQQHQSQKNENTSQKQKKNNSNKNNNNNGNKQAQFPLVGTLVNFNKMKGNNKQRNVKNTINIQDYSNWSQVNKKQRTEIQPAQSQNVFVLRPMIRNKQARDDRKNLAPRLREPARDMKPPPMKQNPVFIARHN
ncbi:hypothetical protein PVAND_010270 [Polypedilum vanderplanki]|uniref:Uncharacterized protein n=1 Tax=Polypedilum vanderplanki TaxID=319348 RepID=A0A9J6CG59_POLVA|nr:hypothetical protein PVAND_010270 [Polypedilum vanderplanki]